MSSMLHERRCYWVEAEAEALGVKFGVAEIYGIQPARENKELEELKRTLARDMQSVDYSANPTLLSYRQLLDSVGAFSEIASPASLLEFVKRSGRLPKVNTVVDAYNVVSLKTMVVVSAHDLDKVVGNPRIAMTRGDEAFYPLGASAPILLPPGQWAGVVDNHILCQLNCKQSELSKVTLQTRNLMIYVQGNRATSDAELRAALNEVCGQIVTFCGGNVVDLERCADDES